MKKAIQIAGFTMVESLVSLMVLAVVVAALTPSIADVLAAMRLRSAAEALLSALVLARSEAVQRNSRVVMCKSVSGQSCSEWGAWNAGWIVFQDHNNSGIQDPGEPLIYRQQPLPAGVTVAGNSPVQKFVSYTAYGQALQLNGRFQAGTFWVCPASGVPDYAFEVVVAKTGRARLGRVTRKFCAALSD